MENIKKEAKESYVFIILLLAFAGVLFINPDNFIKIAINVFGYMSIFVGVILSFYYLIHKNRDHQNLFKGILLVLYGIIAILKTEVLENVFTILLCSFLLFQNVKRIEYSFILKNSDQKIWSYILELSIINIVLSFLLLFKPIINININAYIAIIIIIIEFIIFIENILFLTIKKHLKNN